MTQPSPKASLRRLLWHSSLAAIAIVSPLTPTLTSSVQAGIVDAIQSLLNGGTSADRANNRSQGAATRDKYCSSEDELEAAESASTGSNQSTAIATSSAADAATEDGPGLLALVPPRTLSTTQTNPDFFLYVPFDRTVEENLVLVFELTDQDRNVEFVKTALALPEAPGLVQFQLPAEASLSSGETYKWTFKLACQVIQQPAADAPDVLADGPIDASEISLTELGGSTAVLGVTDLTTPKASQEVYGEIQHVNETAELAAALANSDRSNHYQVYLEYGMWFDMMSSLSTNTTSPEWADILTAFELTGIDPTPQTLTSTSTGINLP